MSPCISPFTGGTERGKWPVRACWGLIFRLFCYLECYLITNGKYSGALSGCAGVVAVSAVEEGIASGNAPAETDLAGNA